MYFWSNIDDFRQLLNPYHIVHAYTASYRRCLPYMFDEHFILSILVTYMHLPAVPPFWVIIRVLIIPLFTSLILLILLPSGIAPL